MSQPVYFSDTTVTTTYTRFQFNFNPKFLISFSADRANTDDLYISYDGQNIHYRLQAGEPLNVTSSFVNGVYVKAKSGTQALRLYAY